jgi:hypothetical protein
MPKRSSKAAHDRLATSYDDIGIKAAAAAVKPAAVKPKKQPQTRPEHARAGVGQAKQGEASMNEQARQFADRTTKTARENIQRAASATEDATRRAEQTYSSAFAGVRELNIKLIEMAQANTEAVFELAHESASAETPSDLATIWAEHVRRQFELMTKQSKELTDLGQKFAGRVTEPIARTVNETFGRSL